MGIKIEGLDKARKQLDDIIENLGDAAIGKWFEKVVEMANEICPDANVSFKRGEKKGEIGQIITPTEESIECVIKAIDQVVKNSPEPSKTMLKNYKSELQKHLHAT